MRSWERLSVVALAATGCTCSMAFVTPAPVATAAAGRSATLRFATATTPANGALSLDPAAAKPAAPAQAAPLLLAPPALYQNAVELGAKKAAMPINKILTLGILSGCHIGFGALLAVTVGGNVPGMAAANPGAQKFLLGAVGLPFGLFMTLVGGGELFTGNTALVTAALLEKRASLKGLLKSWSVSYVGNFLGSLLLAAIAVNAGIIAVPALKGVACAKAAVYPVQSFFRGLLCNWLVCMAVYMSAGASDAGGKLAAIFLPISAFVALGTDHCVANMFLLPAAMMVGADIGLGRFLFGHLLPVTLGNIVGGAAAVAGMYSLAFGAGGAKAAEKTA
eukprot:TRINITY_DN7748_c0_g1_i1.p1 TRINITY_DN7748_c0_g1~~TRINITY_DN7748_c0_g1_i1.p1  ORF type:complete len:335 (-),score=120.32 TRINITY_DN7748_c0_g1_i1:460-1464(-)